MEQWPEGSSSGSLVREVRGTVRGHLGGAGGISAPGDCISQACGFVAISHEPAKVDSDRVGLQ